MWSARGEEARKGGRSGEVFWVRRSRTQEVGVSKEEGKKEKGGNGTSTRGIGESKEA